MSCSRRCCCRLRSSPRSLHVRYSESFSSKCSIYGGFEGICVALVALSAAYSQHTSCDPGSVLSLGTVRLRVPGRALPGPLAAANASFLSCDVTQAVMVPLAIAFGAREYIRCRSNHEHWQRERDREQWELENNPDGEIKEMVEIYTDPRWGVSAKDATLAVRTLAKYPKLFVDMMVRSCGRIRCRRPPDAHAVAPAPAQMHQELEIPRPEGNPLSAGEA